jgi:hypothetical protein
MTNIENNILQSELDSSNDAILTSRIVLIENGYPDEPFLDDGIRNVIKINANLKQKLDVAVEALEGMIWQYCGDGGKDGRIYHDYLSANQEAFDVLGLENGMNYEQRKKAIVKFKEI